jgi:hypothetical protein
MDLLTAALVSGILAHFLNIWGFASSRLSAYIKKPNPALLHVDM